MPLYTKPSSLSLVWASGGAKIKPSDTKIGNGWIVELPPYETFNWWQNKVDGFIAHTNQLGIPSWDSVTEYQAGLSYVQESSGVVYRCTVTNTNKQPSTNPTFWSVAFDSFGSASAVQGALNTHLSNYSVLSGISNLATARNNLGVWGKTESDSRYAYKAGDSGVVFSVANAINSSDAIPRGQLTSLLPVATESVAGISEYASLTETTNGTSNRVVQASHAKTVYLQKADNLASLTDKAQARSNLQLGNSATANVGTTIGTVAAGDDTRIVNAVQNTLTVTAGGGLTGGGTLTGDRTISLGTPSSITNLTQNTSSSTTHTHFIDISSIMQSIVSKNPSETKGTIDFGVVKVKWAKGVRQIGSEGPQRIWYDTPFTTSVYGVLVSTEQPTNSTVYNAGFHTVQNTHQPTACQYVDVYLQTYYSSVTLDAVPFVITIGI